MIAIKYFLGVHMRLSTRFKILFTLGLFANYFSLTSLSLSLKSHMNVLYALKLTELWNTSLLFDLNYKYINGASLLALVKSIYYLTTAFLFNVEELHLFNFKEQSIQTGDYNLSIQRQESPIYSRIIY